MSHAANLYEVGEQDYGIKDDSTSTTRSITSYDDSISGLTRGSENTNHSSSAVSNQRYHQQENGRKQHHGTPGIIKTNASRKEQKFSLHGMTAESLDVGSISALLGSIVYDYTTAGQRRRSSNQKPTITKVPSRAATPTPATTSEQPQKTASGRIKFNPHAALMAAADSRHASSLPAPSQRPQVPSRPTSAMSTPHMRNVTRTSRKSGDGRASSHITIGQEERSIQEVKAAMRELNQQKDDNDCLPAPWYETEMKVAQYLRSKGDIKTTPLECPKDRRAPVDDPLEVPISVSQDHAYLERLYDLRTWNMYKLISEARQDGSYQPSGQSTNDQGTNDAHAADSNGSSHDMMFDME
jgi:hypothetical protein